MTAVVAAVAALAVLIPVLFGLGLAGVMHNGRDDIRNPPPRSSE